MNPSARTTAARLLPVLAREHGGLLRLTRLSSELELPQGEIESGLRELEQSGQLRLLQPCRLDSEEKPFSCPRVYVCDRAMRHRPGAGKQTPEGSAGTAAGAEWEGQVVERLLAAAPPDTRACFYRDRSGREMDLVLDFADSRGRWAIEIKLNAAARLGRSFHAARRALRPNRCWYVHSGDERFRIMEGVEAIGLDELAGLVETSGDGEKAKRGQDSSL